MEWLLYIFGGVVAARALSTAATSAHETRAPPPAQQSEGAAPSPQQPSTSAPNQTSASQSSASAPKGPSWRNAVSGTTKEHGFAGTTGYSAVTQTVDGINVTALGWDAEIKPAAWDALTTAQLLKLLPAYLVTHGYVTDAALSWTPQKLDPSKGYMAALPWYWTWTLTMPGASGTVETWLWGEKDGQAADPWNEPFLSRRHVAAQYSKAIGHYRSFKQYQASLDPNQTLNDDYTRDRANGVGALCFDTYVEDDLGPVTKTLKDADLLTGMKTYDQAMIEWIARDLTREQHYAEVLQQESQSDNLGAVLVTLKAFALSVKDLLSVNAGGLWNDVGSVSAYDAQQDAKVNKLYAEQFATTDPIPTPFRRPDQYQDWLSWLNKQGPTAASEVTRAYRRNDRFSKVIAIHLQKLYAIQDQFGMPRSDHQ